MMRLKHDAFMYNGKEYEKIYNTHIKRYTPLLKVFYKIHYISFK